MTNQTRDRLLISMAIMLHDIVEKNPSLFDFDRDDKDALWMSISKATAEHHKETKEQDETIQELEATIAKLKERCHQAEEHIDVLLQEIVQSCPGLMAKVEEAWNQVAEESK